MLTLQKTTIEIDKPSTLLSEKQKYSICLQLQKISADFLKPALINAAFSMCQFPFPLNSKIEPLQKAYKEHQKNEHVKPLLELAIKTYFDTEGLEHFQKLCKEKFIEKNWQSEFLMSLSKSLNIRLHAESMVEIAIHQGKVYWRIVKDDVVLYERSKQKGQIFDFEKSKKIRMTWKNFREFKDSGKRCGTVAITQQRFTSHFASKSQHQAASVWQELKEKGILNKNDRLSDGWRMISNKEIELASLSSPWGLQHWDIAGVLYTIANNMTFKEIINNVDIPNAIIYRSERSLKKWGGSSKKASPCLIKNEDRQSKLLCTKLWDVSIKKDLTAHRDTSDEEALNISKLNYDHIPSSAALKKENEFFQQSCNTKIIACENDLKSIGKTIQSYSTQLTQASSQIVTRQKIHNPSNPEIQALKEKQAIAQKDMDSCLAMKKQLIVEGSPNWWTVAVPEKLHSQGETYLKSTKEQQKSLSAKDPFFSNISAYLNILETRWKEFLPSEDEYIKALGAFRYLYRCQVKEPNKINGNWEVGITPFYFFQNQQKCHDLDNLFHERLQRFLLKREGASELESDKISKNFLS